MKILLVQPANGPKTIGGDGFFRYEPLALEYLAAGLRAHHDVQIVDLRFDPDLTAALTEQRPNLVGFTAYTVHVDVVRRLADAVRAWNPEVPLVVGGHHATVAPADFVGWGLDYIVRGEGVHALQDLAAALEAGTTIAGIAGLIDARDEAAALDQISARASEPLSALGVAVSLDDLPLPDRSLNVQHRGEYYADYMRPLASIRTSKGCPSRCNFCALWKLTGGKYLIRDPDRIVAELATIEEETVFFADDESLVSAKRMRVLAERIRAAGIKKKYFLYGRSDTIVRHPELLEQWQDIGLRRVFVGFESYRDEDLQRVNKRSSVAQNEQAIAILSGLGLDVYASWMVQLDYTADEFRAFGDYCRSQPLAYQTFSVLTPLPGTDLFASVSDQLILKDFDCFDFLHPLLPTKLPLPEYFAELAKLYRRAMPPKALWKLLRRFPLRRLPGFLRSSNRVLGELKQAAQHYPAA